MTKATDNVPVEADFFLDWEGDVWYRHWGVSIPTTIRVGDNVHLGKDAFFMIYPEANVGDEFFESVERGDHLLKGKTVWYCNITKRWR